MRISIIWAILLMAGSVTFAAATGISSCQAITAPGEYVLTNDLVGATETNTICLQVLADDVEINCTGHSITGYSNSSTHYGIHAYNRDNVTIRNCEISNYLYEGMHIRNSGLVYVVNVQTHDNLRGINAINSSVLLNEVTSYDNGYYGFVFQSTDPAGIFNCKSYNNGLRDVWLYNALDDPTVFEVSGLVLDNPSGTMEDYVNLTMNDFIDTGETYKLTWTSSDTPAGYDSFNNMYLVVDYSSAGSIDFVGFSWTADQETGYNVSALEIWQKDIFSLNWTMLTSGTYQRQIFTQNVGQGILGLFVPESVDDDGDGVPDEDDLCPGTVPDEIPDVSEGHYYLGPDGVIYDSDGPTDLTGADTYGCSVQQIMYCKPGNNQGESQHGMSPGTLNVWMNQLAWASDCQVDGVVALQGENSALPDVDAEQDGKPDWWCEEHPNKC